MLQASSKATGTSDTLIYLLPSAVPFSKAMEGSKFTLPKPSRGPKFPQNLSHIDLLSTTGKLFEKVILKLVQRHTEERRLFNGSQFGFRAHRSTTRQCKRLTDCIT
jgi:hypothetical protein